MVTKKALTMKKLLRSTVLLSALLCIGGLTHSASFDCGKARSAKEKMICADPQLSALDEQLAASYKDALERSGSPKPIRQWQRDWLKHGDVSDCTTPACLTQAVTTRIQMLDAVAGKQAPAARWHGTYERFFNGVRDTDPAGITLIGLNGNKVFAVGNAIWVGPNAAQGQVNTGLIEGIGQIKAGKAVFDLDGCSASIALTPTGLTVQEESGCGGLNVTFNGDYRKQ